MTSENGTPQKQRDKKGVPFCPVYIPHWLTDIRFLVQEQESSCCMEGPAEEFHDIIQIIVQHCRDIYKSCMRLHQIKELWMYQHKASCEKTKTPATPEYRRLLATAITFIDYVRLWAKMIQPPLRLAYGFCLFCARIHQSEACHLYKDEEERTLRIKDMGLCPRCLGSSHSSRNCGSACSACGRRHQEVLCDKYRKLNEKCGGSGLTRQLIDKMLEDAVFHKSILDICWKDHDYMPYPYNEKPAIPEVINIRSKVVTTG